VRTSSPKKNKDRNIWMKAVVMKSFPELLQHLNHVPAYDERVPVISNINPLDGRSTWHPPVIKCFGESHGRDLTQRLAHSAPARLDRSREGKDPSGSFRTASVTVPLTWCNKTLQKCVCHHPNHSRAPGRIRGRGITYFCTFQYWLQLENTACYMLHSGLLSGFELEDGGDMVLRNIGWLSTDYTALYPRR
jgi:hypothetical protein